MALLCVVGCWLYFIEFWRLVDYDLWGFFGVLGTILTLLSGELSSDGNLSSFKSFGMTKGFSIVHSFDLMGLASGLTKTLGIFGYFTVNRWWDSELLEIWFYQWCSDHSRAWVASLPSWIFKSFIRILRIIARGFMNSPHAVPFTNAQVQSSILETGILQAKSDISLG